MPRAGIIRCVARCLAVLASTAILHSALADIVPNPNLMSPAIYRKLRAVQAMISSADYKDALTQLNYLKSVTTNSYEDAVVHDMLARVNREQGHYQEAFSNLKQALADGAMSREQQQAALLMLGKLQVSNAQYAEAVNTLHTWMDGSEDPSADALISLAIAYAKNSQCSQAVTYARRAVQQTDHAPESWYLLWLSCLYKTRDYKAAIPALYDLLGRWPQRTSYWRQLSESYAQLGEINRALAVYVLMYRQGMLHEQQDLLNLFSLYRQNHLPYQAAQLLQHWLDSGRISASTNNYDLLAGAWLDAQEQSQAIAALTKAAKLASTGEPYLQQAQLYLQRHQWFAMIEATQKALAKGRLAHPGLAYLLQGVGEAQNKQFSEAQAAFMQAVRYATFRVQAQAWLRYVTARLPQTT